MQKHERVPVRAMSTLPGPLLPLVLHRYGRDSVPTMAQRTETWEAERREKLVRLSESGGKDSDASSEVRLSGYSGGRPTGRFGASSVHGDGTGEDRGAIYERAIEYARVREER